MSKRLKAALLVLLSIFVLSGAGLYLFRNALLQALISSQLSQRGLPLQSISALDISLHAFRLQGLTAGENKALRVDNLEVAWQLPDPFAGKPLSVEVTGLQAAFDLREARSARDVVKSMTPLPVKDIRIPWLPDFSLKDSVIDLYLPAGDAKIVLSGGSARERPGAQMIHLRAMVSGSLAQTEGLLIATLDTQGNLQGSIKISDGMLNLPEAAISSFAGEATFAFAAWRLQQLNTGFVFSGIKLPGKVSNATINPAAPLSGTAAMDQITFQGGIHAAAQSLTGAFDVAVNGGQLSAPALEIQQLSVSLPLRIVSAPDNGRIGLRTPGYITLGRIDSGIPVHFRDPPRFSISQADLEWARNRSGWALAHEIAITLDPLNLQVERAEPPAMDVQIQPGKIAFNGKFSSDENYQGQFTVADAAIALPQAQLQFQGISATLFVNDPKIGTAADFAFDRLIHRAADPRFAPLSFAGSIRNEAEAGKPPLYTLNGAGGVPELRYLKITGKHATGSGNGRLKVEVVPLDFTPRGLQPGVLSPVLAQLEEVSGHIGASIQFQWSKEGLRSQATAELRDLSFAHESTKLSDLNVKLQLSDLLPPRSPPRQTITIRRIDAGIPLENLRISYQIESTDRPQIVIEQAQFSVLDGMVSVAPAVIDPAAARSDTLIRISHIDLETFFNLIKVEGLTGTGHLDGEIPLTLEEGQVTITNGRLAAKAPGVLRFKSEKASQLLASSGKEMNLLLQAVQDFHYTELSLNLDKSVTHDLVAKLSLLGNNPKVKEGQIFRLNIKLEADIDKILQTINQGYHLSHEILRGSLRLH